LEEVLSYISKVFPAIHISVSARSSFQQLLTLIWVHMDIAFGVRHRKFAHIRNKDLQIPAIDRATYRHWCALFHV